jgi:predicted negative regulator of RcsB-dependent stress response
MSSGAIAALAITLGVLFIIGATTGVIVWSWHRLQQHRADAVALAAYRKLAEEAVANQAELRDEIRKLREHVSAVEHLMRDVG